MKLLVVTQKVDAQDQLLGFFIEWLKKFSGKFEKLTVLCLEKGEFNSSAANIKIISLGKDRGAGKLKLLSTFYFLLSTLRSEYDAVFVHMNPIWVVLGGPLWRLMGKKIFFWYTSGGVTAKLKLAEKWADVIFTASKESFRLPSKKVIVTGHGIDTELFRLSNKQQPVRSGATGDKLKLLSVGRIAPVKNFETLIEAAKILKENRIDFKITMIGEAPLEQDKNYEEGLKLKVKNLKLEENFNFAGKVGHKDLPQYYQSHDIFIHLSKTGSLDKTILEAMSCGIKVLSSNDSAKSFLPEELAFNGDDAVGLAKKIIHQAGTETDSGLREFVIQNHNLDNLIEKISNYIIET